MARRWWSRKARPDAVGETGPADADPAAETQDDDTETTPAQEAHEAAEPEGDAGPRGRVLFDRLLTGARRAAVGLGAAVAARTPAVRAAVLPRLSRLLLALAGGLLLCASFPPLNWWWAAVVAAALLAWVLTHPATTPVGGLGYGFLFGLALYLPLLPWISLLVGAVPWLVLATTCALFPGLFGLFAVVVRRLPGWPVWFALVWAAQEWLKADYPFGGFPWGSVAFGQAEGPFLPLVQLGGVALLSAAIMLVGFSATAIAREIVTWWPRAGRARAEAGDGADPIANEAGPPPAVVLPGVCICLVLFAAVAVWPQVRHAGTGSGGEPTVTVAAVQGNVPRLGFGFNAQRRAVLDNHVRETLQLAEDVRAGAAPQPQFVIWPEDSSDIDPLVNADAAQQIAKAATAIHAPILVGTVLDVPGRPQDAPAYTNTVIVWNPVTGPADRHDKEIVQPFGEYLPMAWLFTHLSGYADRAGYIVPGTSDGVVHIAGVPVGVATCWEVIFDREPRKAVLQRRPAAGRAQQQRHLQSDDERAATGVRQGEGRGARPVRRGGGHHRDQRDDRARRRRIGANGLLRARLPGHAGAAQDEADAGHPLGPVRAMGPGRGGRSGHSGRDTAQWLFRGVVPASDSAQAQAGRIPRRHPARRGRSGHRARHPARQPC